MKRILLVLSILIMGPVMKAGRDCNSFGSGSEKNDLKFSTLTSTSNLTEIFAVVKDSNGQPVSNYAIHIGSGSDPDTNALKTIFTNNNGIAHDSINLGLTSNLYGYVYNCDLKKVVDLEVAVPKTATDSTLFTFTVNCPTDTCAIALSYKLVDPDSNLYEFHWERVGASIEIITPLWSFSDGTLASGTQTIQKKVGSPGWFKYCFDLGCSGATCDSFYVEPDCQAGFFLDTINSIVFDGNLILWLLPDLGTDYNYYWDFGDGTTSTNHYPVHTYDSAGFHTICLYVSYDDGTESCGDTICKSWNVVGDNVTFEVMDPDKIGIREYGFNKLSLYPNPVIDYRANLSWDHSVNVKDINLYDLNGRLVRRWKVQDKFQQSLSLDGLARGTYLLKVTGKTNANTLKLIIP